MSHLFSVDSVFFTVLGYPMSYIEFVGTILYLLSVWLIARRNVFTWPVGIVSVMLYMVLFYQIQLYSDAMEQVYYLGASAYGWWFWSRSRQENHKITDVSYSSRVTVMSWLGVTAVLSVALGAVMSRIHLWAPGVFPEPAAYPYLDAVTTVMSLVAMWLMARRHIESWIYWIVVDVVGIWLYFVKDVRFISLLYVVLLILAIRGLIDWRGAGRRPVSEAQASGDNRATEPSSKLVLPKDLRLPLIAHVPHASTVIPPWARHQFVLDDARLREQVVCLTDWHADELFSWVLELGGSMFVNTMSRLVLDPERFADDADEPMAKVGQGVVYTHGTEGQLLAEVSAEERARRIREHYVPYHEALTDHVGALLKQFGRVLILDCHSFATEPLQSEPDQTPDRPDICVGTDSFHTPAELADGLVVAFRAEGYSVDRDRPFAGTLAPLEFLGTESGVQSVMIEVRRGLYCDEATGERAADFSATRSKLELAVRAALRT